MWLGRTSLFAEECLHHQQNGICFYCGHLGHQVSTCHVKGANTQNKNQLVVSQNIILDNPAQFRPQLQFVSEHDSLMISVVIDYGSDDLINSSFVRRIVLKTFLLPRAIEVNAIDGKPLGRIIHHTQSVKLIFSDSHTELLSFHVLDSMTHQIISGHPWLEVCNLNIDWISRRIASRGTNCSDSENH